MADSHDAPTVRLLSRVSLSLAHTQVFSVGSHAHGPADVDWAEKRIAVSQYSLSASVAIGRPAVRVFECLHAMLAGA